MKALEEKIKKMLKDNLPEGDCPSLLCALSGGKDSCCLLSALCGIKETFGFTLYACHVDHKIRPPEETGKDRRVCLSLCEQLGVPLSVVSVDVPALCRETGKSVELCAREERYRVLEEERRKRGCDFIVTAHTSTDSAETMLHNLLRGRRAKGCAASRPSEEGSSAP